ncbi:MAG: hypothetical protein HY597_00345 [Candidatus Omnitrophica bacterium]|nr:hypothetical protein [Candidatus Omnitrophota bacterium]
MKYGRFSQDGTEFIITSPVTPRPWINYLTNEEYCAVISQSAGGYSFYKDCRTDRLLRWSPENLYVDRPGRYLFVREQAQGRPRVWSATYQPMQLPADRFEARHGLGYTVITSEYHGIRIEITYFVPVDAPCEIWAVKVANRTRRARALELFPYVEWLLGDYHLELRYRNIMNLYNRVWLDEPSQAIFAKKTAAWGDFNIRPFTDTVFFASSLRQQGVATIKGDFLGPTNTEERPAMLLSGQWKTLPFCSGEDAIGCLRHVVKLKAGQTVEFSVILGQTEGEAKVRGLIDQYRQAAHVGQALAKTRETWRRRILDNIVVETPDQDFNTIMNVWVKYQLYICNFWSRSPSFYHEGSGGRGYRDSCQDAEGIMAINTAHAKAKLLKLASLHRRDGTCAPGWSDTTGPAGHRPNKDHPVWLTSTVAAYVKETGDQEILRARIAYIKDRWIRGWEVDLQWKGGAVEDEAGTLFEHLWKNLDFTFNDVGPHGIPLIGHADWNDALDAAGIQGKGESLWLGMALVRSQKMLAELAELIGEAAKAAELRRRAQTMTDRINQVGWDGAWYAYGFTDEGELFGSAKNREGKIYLNTQAWAILSGVATPERQERLLRSVDEHLDRPHGLALFYPAYSRWEPTLGRISMFSEGTKENAAIFCHAATFQIVADLSVGRGNQGYRSLRKVMPNAQPDYDRYKAEPYTYAEYLIGPESPYRSGEGAFTWITGTAGWTFMAGTEWVMGARRDYEGLRIDPSIPSTWKRCKITRPFRGATYEITILNPQGVQHGVASLRVDGQPIAGTVVRPHRDGRVHQVEVVLGTSSSAKPSRTPGRRTVTTLT